VLFGVSAGIVTIVVGLLLSAWDATEPASFQTTHGPARASSGNFFLPVTVENTGDVAAADVVVVVKVVDGGTVVERAEQRLTTLSGNETEEVTFVFRRDPSPMSVQVGVASYTKP
jgi:uncharacterized protein (TIGR02588 family)